MTLLILYRSSKPMRESGEIILCHSSQYSKCYQGWASLETFAARRRRQASSQTEKMIERVAMSAIN
jgi:hypothetical protein